MRRSNYDLSTALVAIGAVAVLISLFLDWYGDPGLSGFDVFEVTDWLLVALSVGALVVIATEALSGGGVPNNRLAWICGALAFLVVAQVLDPPPVAREQPREIGAWVALFGAALMVTGAVLAMAQISVTIDVAERERRRRTAAVDARGDVDVDADADAASEAPTTASRTTAGLWQAPSSRPASDPPPPESDPPSRPVSEPPSRPVSDPPPPASPKPASKPKPPTDDPERTQPLRPADRPDGDGEGDAKS